MVARRLNSCYDCRKSKLGGRIFRPNPALCRVGGQAAAVCRPYCNGQVLDAVTPGIRPWLRERAGRRAVDGEDDQAEGRVSQTETSGFFAFIPQ